MTDTSALRFEIEIQAPIDQVWHAWTTREGILSFFAPDCHVELAPGGAYEMYFNLGSVAGERGGEGCKVLAIEAPYMLSFTWNAPPEFPDIRSQKTHITVHLYEASSNLTQVVLSHDGWGSGTDWKEVRAYFDRAWGQVVLPRLQKRFIEGPIQWNEMGE